ncbi:recombinase family protein [Candidatus Roizmanbacteria bacterium]|nr:recombinase family protein [Candidatus Roizmanbacteria bacterium]
MKVYREEGVSAKTLNRPELLRLLEDCRANQKKVSAIFIYKIDRITRDTYDFLAIKKKLADYGIRILSVTEPTEDSPTGEFLETLFAANAKLDNATKSLRTLDCMKKRIEAGWALGRAPVGYLNVSREGKQVIDPDLEQFDLVKKAWEEMAKGIYSLETIVPYMNKLGIMIKIGPRRIPITRNQQTQRIFRDKFYCGYVVSKKFSIDKRGCHLPMISEDLFYRVQAIIDGRSFTAGINYKKQNENFPLRGALCKKCGFKMTGSFSTGRAAKYPYYSCNNGKHRSPSIPKEKFERDFLELVNSVEPKKELVGLFCEMVRERYKSRYAYLGQKEKTVEQDIVELYDVRKRLVEKNLKGIYSDEVFKEQMASIEHEILVKKTLQSEAKLDKIDIDIVVNFMKSFLWNLGKAWKEGSLQQRKAITGSIFPQNVVYCYPKF